MASGYDLEVTVESAQGLKNVNWRHGLLRPYAVVWVDPNDKRSTMVDDEGGTFPVWAQTFVLPLPSGPVEYSTLYIDVVHGGSEEDTEPLIGSARLKLRDVLDEADFGETCWRRLQLKRPSGRPRGKVEVEVCVWEPRYRPPNPYGAPPYWVPPAYGYPCGPPAGGYAYVTNNPPPLQYGYDGELAAAAYGQEEEEEEKSNFEGIGKVFAVGALVGALGGLVLAGWLGSKIVDGDGGAWVQRGSGCYNSRTEPILVGYVVHETRNPPRAEYSVLVWVVAPFVLLFSWPVCRVVLRAWLVALFVLSCLVCPVWGLVLRVWVVAPFVPSRFVLFLARLLGWWGIGNRVFFYHFCRTISNNASFSRNFHPHCITKRQTYEKMGLSFSTNIDGRC